MNKVALLLVASIISGCATYSGVIPEGKEDYLIIATSGRFGYDTPIELKIDAHKQASAFCGINKMRHETLSERMVLAGTLSDYSEYSLKFKCVIGTAGPEDTQVAPDSKGSK